MSAHNLPLHSPRFKPAPPINSPFWDHIRVDLGFTIIGAPKCGTTWLHTCLQQHPELWLPDEQNFFTLFSERGPAYYNQLYADSAGRLCGDYSNTYMLDEALPHILAARYPHLKIIMVCRNPIQRAFSHYLMDVDKSGIKPDQLSFYQALFQPVTYSYYDLGLYFKHIRKYLDHFPLEAVEVLIFEDLIKRPQENLIRIFNFLGVDSKVEVKIPAKENTWTDRVFTKNRAFRSARLMTYQTLPSGLYASLKQQVYPRLRRAAEKFFSFDKPMISADARNLLREQYDGPNRQLASFLNMDLSGWER